MSGWVVRREGELVNKYREVHRANLYSVYYRTLGYGNSLPDYSHTRVR